MIIRLVLLLMALAPAITMGAIRLTPGESNLNVAEDAWFLIDETSRLQLADVRSIELKKVTDPTLNLGYTPGHVWLKLDVVNSSTQPGSWFLSFNRATLNSLAVYVVSPGRSSVEKLFDINTPGTERASLQRFGTLATEITLAPGEEATYYIRYQGPNSSAMPLTIEHESDLLSRHAGEVTFFLVVAAGVLTLIIYNALMYGLTGDRPFLYYSLAQTALLAYFAHIEGMTTVYLWPDNPRLGGPLAPILGALISVSIIAFARSFLETRERSTTWDALLRWTLWLSCAALLFALSSPTIGSPANGIVQLTVYLAGLATWLLLPALAVTASVRWHAWHWPLVPAWIIMSAFTFYTAAVFAGLATITDWHAYLYGVAAYSEAGFLSVALALRIRALRVHSLDTERALSASLERELAEARRARQLAQSRSAAIAELAQQGQLMRAASHDSRQMVSTLRQTAYALEHGGSAEHAGELLEQVAEYLDVILSTTTSGSYTGGFDDKSIALDTVPAEQILRPLVLMFGRNAQEKGIDLRLRAHDLEVVTDRALLLRVLANLTSNAIKYSRRGGVIVTARRRPSGVLFQVHDTGRGLSQSQVAILLSKDSPSERFDANGEGSGTGWNVVRDLAGRLNGSLGVRSETGRGTTVSLLLEQDLSRPLNACFAYARADRPPEINHLRSSNVNLRLVAFDSMAEIDGLTIIDLDAGGSHAGLDMASRLVSSGMQVAVATYDHDLNIRSEIAAVTPYILYKPLTNKALAVLCSYL